MAIHIIGESPSNAPAGLPRPEIEIPGTETAPAARLRHDAAEVVRLLGHEDALVRGFGIELAVRLDHPDVNAAVLRGLDDEDPFVFSEALSLVAERRIEGGASKLRALFADAEGQRAAGLAVALGRLDPAGLPDVISARGRIDDEAFPSVMTALAVAVGTSGGAVFDKALARMAMQSPARQQALHTGALLSGAASCCKRALGDAIGDSNAEAPDGQTHASRAAVASLASLPPVLGRMDAGAEVLREAVQAFEAQVLPAMDESSRAPLKAALQARNAGDILRALEPVASRELLPDLDPEDLGNLPERRQGLLKALVERARDIERLDQAAAAVFLAAAAQAATLVLSGSTTEAGSPAMVALATALQVESEALAAEGTSGWAKRFEARSEREMRSVTTIIVRQMFHRAATFRSMVEACLRAGHGAAIVGAAAESEDGAMHDLLIDACEQAVEDAEAAVLEMLEDAELQPPALELALRIAERLRTERVGLAAGARFFDLRRISKGVVARVLAYAGGAWAKPLLESRAFEDEPEEAAWVLLSLSDGDPIEGKLEASLTRIRNKRYAPQDAPLDVELECEACGEAALYGFERAFVDPDAKDGSGDPAFVGDTTCKACGAEDQLKPTPTGERIMTHHMMRFLESMQAGIQATPVVAPGHTSVGGRKLGFAAALRELNERVAESETAVRPRLERARLRMMLGRTGVDEDLAAARAQVPDLVEALVLEGTRSVRERNPAAGLPALLEALERLRGDEEPRIYDAESAEALRISVEGLLIELADQGLSLPRNLDLSEARRRRARREEAASQATEAGKRKSGFAKRKRR